MNSWACSPSACGRKSAARLYEDQQNLPVEERVRRGVTNWLDILGEDPNLTRIGFSRSMRPSRSRTSWSR